jgi:hypothetical protein
MNLLGLVVALQMLFPAFGNTNGNYSTLALTNVSSVDAEFTVRLKAPNGQETNLVALADRIRKTKNGFDRVAFARIGSSGGRLGISGMPLYRRDNTR